MTNFEQIRGLVAQGESEVLELKKSTAESEKACRTICAMANGNGGNVLFGVTPQGKIIGQTIGAQTLEQLAQTLSHFEPPLFPEIARIKIDGDNKEVIAVKVLRTPRMPCTYRGNAYKRVANTTIIMPRDEYQRLLFEELHGQERWENKPANGWNADMLDTKEIILTLEEAIRRGRSEDPQTRDPVEILRGLGLLDRNGNLLRAAVVLFTRESTILPDLPQLKLQVARFQGIDRTRFLDNRQFLGNAFSLLRRAERFLIENLPIAGHIVPGIIERVDDPLYPLEALREALVNAFCHRDYAIGGGSVKIAIYDDRLEIISSGGLHFGLTAADLFKPHESLPWNPLIAQVFYRRGIIESWGRGTLKIAELTKAAGLIQPEIKVAVGAVTVSFRPNQYVAPRYIGHDLSERQNTILQMLGDGGSKRLSVREIAKRLNTPDVRRPIMSDLNFMKQLGLVKVQGHGFDY